MINMYKLKWDNRQEVEFEELKGKIITNIEKSNDQIDFYTDNNETYVMYHHQDCCENVSIESITGDLDDLLNSEILLAEETTNYPDNESNGKYYDSVTYTFYKLATINGYVDIRWFGTSNCYYSESVNFVKIK